MPVSRALRQPALRRIKRTIQVPRRFKPILLLEMLTESVYLADRLRRVGDQGREARGSSFDSIRAMLARSRFRIASPDTA